MSKVKTQTMTATETLDVTAQLVQMTRWSVGILDGRTLMEMPTPFRFDYELKVTPQGVRVIQRDQDEGKVG